MPFIGKLYKFENFLGDLTTNATSTMPVEPPTFIFNRQNDNPEKLMAEEDPASNEPTQQDAVLSKITPEDDDLINESSKNHIQEDQSLLPETPSTSNGGKFNSEFTTFFKNNRYSIWLSIE